ncbi:MAG: ATP-binding protein, partial [Armatimonadetes bacterium]|nr:ATP-binding protein [Armatimonadota bacterium]
MWRDILGIEKKQSSLLELTSPHRTFNDVVLPDETRQQLYEALTQIRKHGLIFQTWGLGERHPSGAGLAFNFAGPPGTGKTICAEAVAYTLGRKLLRVRYSELESCWVGETGKNIRAVFREARAQNAVLFFDEADSIASRRFSNVQAGYEREANQAVNILLKELEEHEGVVIFATNMASN